ncbi:ABC transporter ATP-binding protein [Magnetospirillum sp. UT-4]|uniref:ABC transporter ATP-binding protein n=1 Tax=Magnetospirillum sp. UT-4 TaxID=2681467 RepID=UPI0013864B65|nr:ABC transporter ATP-binding protein [Magnetospirillum sp. UT-4]CAA7614134.1 Fe(3+) ions import ATP-binding protein FbpC [Magnetospirillum sp. UT-4]
MTGLELETIRHAYGDHRAVDDVSLAVGPGELVCLLGPSGCGKTTTLRIAAGLENPTGGRVILDGAVVAGAGVLVPPERRNVGFLFQDYALFPHLDVAANVEFGLTALPRAERRRRAMEMLEQVGMAAFAGAWPHQLSGGQQQRVALARALAPGPRLMLLDEPFSGLDKRLRDRIRDDTLHLLKASHVSTLMVTHDPEEAMFMADRIAVMRKGRIMQLGTPAELYGRPADPFVASFFGEVNVVEAQALSGRVTTPLGPWPCPGLADGEAAEVLVRPEGITLAEDAAGPGQVLAARLLGRSSLVHLRLDWPGHAPVHLHVRLSGRPPPPEGTRVALTIDPAQVFVFPAGEE